MVNIVYRDDGTAIKVLTDVCYYCGQKVDINKVLSFHYARSKKEGEWLKDEFEPICLECDES